MKKIFIVFLAMFSAVTMRAQMLAISTDAVQDALLMPNVGFELVIGQHSTLSASYTYGRSSWVPAVNTIHVFQPEYRHFFSGRPMYHHYVGFGGLVARYDLTWKGKQYQGDGLGVGLTFGYVFKINDRLNIDCHAGAGFVGFKHKEFQENNNHFGEYFQERGDGLDPQYFTNAKGFLTIPTKIGVSVSYILDNYKTRKK